MKPEATKGQSFIGDTDIIDTCYLCEGRSFQPVPTPGRWIGTEVFGSLDKHLRLMRCDGCGLVFVNPRPSFENMNKFYSGDTYTCHEVAGSASTGSRADFLLNWIDKHLPPNTPKTLLDYGAGGGGFMLHARKRGWEVQGFEPGRRGLETCRAACLVATDHVEELPLGYFGLITLHHVLEHVANPVEVLGRIRKLLTPNGRLFVAVPNAHSLRARLALPALSKKFNVDERYRAFPIHLTYYDDKTLKRMLVKAGWAVDATFTIGIGLDEFFIRSEPATSPKVDSKNSVARRSFPKHKLRHMVRDAFLNLGLGENLAVIARLGH